MKFKIAELRLAGVFVLALLGSLTATELRAAAPSNGQSALGINLTFFRDQSSEWSVVDAFRQSRDWSFQSCAPNCAAIQVDADGWIRSMPVGAFADTLLLDAIAGHYPAGQYVVLRQGQGTIQYLGDATLVQSLPGKDVIAVTPTNAGIRIRVSAPNPSDYLRNLRVLLPGYDETNFESSPGHPRFHPSFTDKLRRYRVIRFLNWQETNASVLTDWASRPKLNDARWSKTGRGVPVEVLVDLANQVKADPWFNMPHLATDDFITQFATLVRASLSPFLRVYVEYSNEIWGDSPRGDWVELQGTTLWPGGTKTAYQKRLNWFGMRTAQTCDLWKAAFGAESDRVVCVMASSGGNTSTSVEELDCPLWTAGAPCHAHEIGALAMGGYFGGYLGTPANEAQVQSWTNDADGGLGRIFQELSSGGVLPGGPAGGAVQATLNGSAAQLAVAAARGLELVAYEGGQALYGSGTVVNNAAVTGLFTAANRDARMGDAYAQLFSGWKALGGHLFNHFNNVSQYGSGGNWGAFEYMDQLSSPKYDALMSFLTANPCWWPSCALVVPAGRVPGDLASEPPITIAKSGGDIALSWSAGCAAYDSDYAVFEGLLGDFTSHVPVACSTNGALALSLTPGSGSRYYLVVPQNGVCEGSYGVNGAGSERTASAAACYPQALAACP